MASRGGGAGRGRGRKQNHKGQHRHFTGFDEIMQQNEEIRREKERADGDESDGDGDKKEPVQNIKEFRVPGQAEDESDSDDESSDDEKPKKSGVLPSNNPNRVTQKMKKVDDLERVISQAPTELSRREREAIEKEQKRQEYLRLHAAGKTDEARADLARLAIIKQQRDDAALKRKVEIDKKASAESERKARDEERKQAQFGKTEGGKGKGKK